MHEIRHRLAARCLAAAAVSWLPLFALTLLSEATGDAAARPLLVDLSVDARFLLALPLFIAANAYVGAKRSGLVTYGDLGEGLFRAFARKWTGLDNEKQAATLVPHRNVLPAIGF